MAENTTADLVAPSFLLLDGKVDSKQLGKRLCGRDRSNRYGRAGV